MINPRGTKYRKWSKKRPGRWLNFPTLKGSYMRGFTVYDYMYFKNSLIIHEENTKKNHKRVVSLYVDKDFPSFT
jgi:hypothetical protein